MSHITDLECSHWHSIVKLEGKVYKTVLCWAETWVTSKRQEKRIEVNDMRMQRWTCEVICKDKRITKTFEEQREWRRLPKDHGETIELVRSCDEERRRTHAEESIEDAYTRGERKRGRPKTGWKDIWDVDLERAWRWTGRHGIERQSVTPATLYRGGGGRTGLGAGVEMDRVTWNRKTISHTGHPI